jgi:hypothetical protein
VRSSRTHERQRQRVVGLLAPAGYTEWAANPQPPTLGSVPPTLGSVGTPQPTLDTSDGPGVGDGGSRSGSGSGGGSKASAAAEDAAATSKLLR